MSFTIRSDQNVAPISRFIYGNNFHDFAAAHPKNLTLSRLGGNRWTAYNWETNASNAGTDWYNQNDGYLSNSNTPGAAVTPSITTAHANNAAMLITVPIAGYVAADKSGGGDVNQSGSNYLATRFKQSLPKKGSALSLTPSTTDAYVYQDEFVNFIDKSFPGARSDATRTIFYSLDNEPDLWASTHPRIRGDASGSAGNKATYAEMVQRSSLYADAIKSVVPQAIVFGPVNYGWQGMVTLQDAPDAAGRDFITYYLQQMSAAHTSAGKRLLDVLDVHWYSEATNAAGTRITNDATGSDASLNAARMQAPRSLWDAGYTEQSWIGQWNGAIRLIPRLREKIAASYPGTRLSISEYNHGGSQHISGGIAQADTLGIFGREGVFAASFWSLTGSNDSFAWGAFEMFRNYDGVNGSFGDTSIAASTTNVADSSVYASVDAGSADRMVLVVINKTASSQTAALRIWHTRRFARAKVFQLTAASSVPQAAGTITLTQINAFQYAMPAYSVSTLVLEP
ncbi:glycoside hydrolase family 44 protein [Viridibacterium curvum]|uniref:glycoside hydrolase family 44 protein n=1 Tax=Viridibacterium curvum TaxID=1101404 RepID=UPI0031E904AB